MLAMNESIPACLGPRPNPGRSIRSLPKGSWDTHFHVLGPQSRFPYPGKRKYTPPDAPLEHALQMHAALGIDHGFVVHANTHGFDNEVDMDAVEKAAGRYLAVVRLGGDCTPELCRELHQRGARGVRFAFNPQHGGQLDLDVFSHVQRCLDGLGWFVELHFAGSALPELAPWIASIGVPVVIDHFGRVDPADGLDGSSFRALAMLATRPGIWIKMTGADRISRSGAPYADVVPIARRLIDLAADRMLWGTDWPHTGYFDADRVPDLSVLLDAFHECVPDPSIRESILVRNPLRLLDGGC